MNVCTTFVDLLSQNSGLHKVVSLPTFPEHITSPEMCPQSQEEGYWRKCTKWIMRLRKKVKISKDSLYLAVSYLNKLVKMGFNLYEDNWQRVAAALVLISAKMNEIYPPKMSTLLNRCSRPVSKHELALTESEILTLFNFQMSFSEISYSYLLKALIHQGEERLNDGEKLLGLAVTQMDIMGFGQQILALGIVYLIKPCSAREWNRSSLPFIKNAANKIYNLYISSKNISRI